MKVKIMQAMSEKRLTANVNEFISGHPGIKVTDMQFSATIFFFAVMIIYEV